MLCVTGRRKGRSLLLEEGALEWLTSNSHIDSASTQRHIELALCHLAQNGKPNFVILIFRRAQFFYQMLGHITNICISFISMQRKMRMTLKEQEA